MRIEHLGIIPDGNRRWAKEHGCNYKVAYDQFTNHICEIIAMSARLQIQMLSIYILSKENLSREASDLRDVLNAIQPMLDQKLFSLVDKADIRIRCIGIDAVPDDKLKTSAKNIEQISHGNSGMVVNLLIGYNPIDEINASLQSAQQFVTVDNLSVPKRVDLLIRTAGGPTRLSNFLPLQCGYANIETLEDNFLDVTCDTIHEILVKYSAFEPKYGR